MSDSLAKTIIESCVMRCIKINKSSAEKFILTQHYSQKMPIFWCGFGLEIENKIEGVCVYGQPSPAVQKHAFRDRDFPLFELSRLVIQTEKRNAASFLIGNSLKMLPRPSAVVSYADTEQNHAGIVYQATNWLYTGRTLSHDVIYIINGKRTHPLSLQHQGITAPRQWAKENLIETVPPMHKHRYFYLLGNRKDRKRMMECLVYPVVPEYPKTEKTMYKTGSKIDMAIAQQMELI